MSVSTVSEAQSDEAPAFQSLLAGALSSMKKPEPAVQTEGWLSACASVCLLTCLFLCPSVCTLSGYKF